jgi:prepilin signal peptidase PulO-like enzyme (type II secretory pathway)
MMSLEIFTVCLLGLCFGSFNTLLAYRLPLRKPVVMARSMLITGGKCRHCHTRVHWRYPATELVTALLFLLVYVIQGFTFNGLLIALLGSQIVALCIIDFEHRIIPDELQISMGLTGLLYGLNENLHVATMLGGMVAGASCGYLLQKSYLLLKKRHGLGMGDVKFMAVAGIWLGIAPLLPFFFYAGMLGIVSAVLWRVVRHDPYFPFGPALAISLFVLVLYPDSEAWFQKLSLLMVTTVGII